MKLIGYIFAFVLIASQGFGQEQSIIGVAAGNDIIVPEESNENSEAFVVVEEMPEFPGGMMAMMKFLQENISYPTQAKENGIKGKVFTKFIIDPKGTVTNIKVLKSSGSALLDSEAVRVVSIMPKWTPGKQNGKPVPVYFNLPINFALGNGDNNNLSTTKINVNLAVTFLDNYGNIIQPHDEKFQKLPEFPGGLDSLNRYVNANKQTIKLPSGYKGNGEVYLKFGIESNGEVTKPVILISSGSDALDEEAIRVAKTIPMWKPAIRESKEVKTYCKLPIRFNL